MKNGEATLKLSQTGKGIDWLKQFDPDDQGDAAKLIDHMRLVSHQEFAEQLQSLIIERAKAVDGPIGLYAEREIRKWKGVPNRLFKEQRGNKNRRAYGVGPQPVSPTKAYDPKVGSEGIVAWLITQLCNREPKLFLNHPGPDAIRKNRIRTCFLVTDFVGSGTRVINYLSAAWRIFSVKSWVSYKLFKFEVVAFSGTDKGVSKVEKHRCRPSISLVQSCPTIETVFKDEEAERIRQICIAYDPERSDLIDSLGFLGTGALIAFAHSCPNNTPRLLHKSGKRWFPLFPARVTGEVSSVFEDRRDKDSLIDRLQRMNENRLASGEWFEQASKDGRSLILLLAALRKSPRFDEALSRNTGLTIPEIKIFIHALNEWKWIDDDRCLTDDGYKQLRYIRNIKATTQEVLSSVSEGLYYPQQLRAPRNASS